MPEGVQLSILSEDERAEYSRRFTDRSLREMFRGRPGLLAAFAFWALPPFAGIAALFSASISDSDKNVYAASAVVWMFAGAPFIVLAMSRAGRSAAEQRCAEYLEEVNYSQRLSAERRGHTGARGGVPTNTRRQSQHEWYGDNPDLNWRHREQAETYGMDVDTYRNNMLENDKD